MSSDDFLNEEQEIIKSREKNSVVIDKESFFERPISDLKLPPAKSLSSNSTIDMAINLMQKNNIGSVVIVEGKKVVGILTERDILMKVIGKISDYKKVLVAEIMTKNPICLHPSDDIIYVMNNMHIGHFRHIPLVDQKGELFSMISVRDVLDYFFNNFSKEITNTTSQPYRGPKNPEEGA